MNKCIWTIVLKQFFELTIVQIDNCLKTIIIWTIIQNQKLTFYKQ